MPHIHIDYDYEPPNYYDGSSRKVIKTYRVFFSDLAKGDYGYSRGQRNFHTIEGTDRYRSTHSDLIRKIIDVLKGAEDYENVQKRGNYNMLIDDKFKIDATISSDEYKNKIVPLLKKYDCLYPDSYSAVNMSHAECGPYFRGSGRRPSRKYKKSAKRVFRKKSRSTRRR